MTVKTMLTLAVYFQAMKPYLLSSWYIVREDGCSPSLLDLKANLNIYIQLAVQVHSVVRDNCFLGIVSNLPIIGSDFRFCCREVFFLAK